MNFYTKQMRENNPLLYKHVKEILTYLMSVEAAGSKQILEHSGISYGVWREMTWPRLRKLGLVQMIPPKTYGYPALFRINPSKYLYVQELLDTYGDKVDLNIEKEVEKILETGNTEALK